MTQKRKETHTIADKKILNSPELHGALLERMGESAVYIVNAEGKIIYASKRSLQLLGKQPAEVLGQDYYTAIRLLDEKGEPLPERKRLVWQALNTKDFHRLTPFFCYYDMSDGSRKQVVVRATQVARRGKPMAVIVQVREAKRVLDVDEMKSLFISFAAHQLKTPSSVVKGFLELMLREGKAAYKPTQWEHLQSVYEANEHLISLSKTLLNLTKIEGGLVEPKVVTCNITELVEDKIASHGVLGKMKQLRFVFQRPERSVYFMTDPVFFTEMLDILLGNALKFSPEGGEVKVRVSVAERKLRVEVEDQGPGIAPEAQKHLFSTTFKNDSSTGGHGLGLFMAGKYLALLKGKIGVTSEPEKGSTFYFTIPEPVR